MSKALKWLLGIISAIALIAFVLGVMANVTPKNDVDGIRNFAVNTAKNHSEFANATKTALEEMRNGINLTSKAITGLSEHQSKQATELAEMKTNRLNDRKEIENAAQSSKDALIAVRAVGKQMRDDLLEEYRKTQVPAASATPPVSQPPVQVQVPTPMPAPQTIVGIVPTDVTVSTSPVRAVQQVRVERESLAPGVMSRRYSQHDVAAHRVIVTKRLGMVTMHNHIPGKWRQNDQILPVQFAPGQGISSYSDADWVSFSSDSPLEIELRK